MPWTTPALNRLPQEKGSQKRLQSCDHSEVGGHGPLCQLPLKVKMRLKESMGCSGVRPLGPWENLCWWNHRAGSKLD